MSKKGYETNEDWDVDACDALPLFQEAIIARRTATGSRRGTKIRRVQTFPGRVFQLPPRCASFGGYNLHGGVQVSAKNRKGERYCSYWLEWILLDYGKRGFKFAIRSVLWVSLVVKREGLAHRCGTALRENDRAVWW